MQSLLGFGSNMDRVRSFIEQQVLSVGNIIHDVFLAFRALLGLRNAALSGVLWGQLMEGQRRTRRAHEAALSKSIACTASQDTALGAASRLLESSSSFRVLQRCFDKWVQHYAISRRFRLSIGFLDIVFRNNARFASCFFRCFITWRFIALQRRHCLLSDEALKVCKANEEAATAMSSSRAAQMRRMVAGVVLRISESKALLLFCRAFGTWARLTRDSLLVQEKARRSRMCMSAWVRRSIAAMDLACLRRYLLSWSIVGNRIKHRRELNDVTFSQGTIEAALGQRFIVAERYATGHVSRSLGVSRTAFLHQCVLCWARARMEACCTIAGEVAAARCREVKAASRCRVQQLMTCLYGKTLSSASSFFALRSFMAWRVFMLSARLRMAMDEACESQAMAFASKSTQVISRDYASRRAEVTSGYVERVLSKQKILHCFSGWKCRRLMQSGNGRGFMLLEHVVTIFANRFQWRRVLGAWRSCLRSSRFELLIGGGAVHSLPDAGSQCQPYNQAGASGFGLGSSTRFQANGASGVGHASFVEDWSAGRPHAPVQPSCQQELHDGLRQHPSFLTSSHVTSVKRSCAVSASALPAVAAEANATSGNHIHDSPRFDCCSEDVAKCVSDMVVFPRNEEDWRREVARRKEMEALARDNDSGIGHRREPRCGGRHRAMQPVRGFVSGPPDSYLHLAAEGDEGLQSSSVHASLALDALSSNEGYLELLEFNRSQLNRRRRDAACAGRSHS